MVQKSHLFGFVVLMAALFVAVSCDKDKNEPKETSAITLTPSTLTLKVGEVGIIKVEGAISAVTWTSSNEAVATVTLGAVEAKAIGDAYITATAGEQTAVAHIYVTGSDGSSLRITPAYVEMNKGETFQMTYGNTYDLPMTWSSSNEQVVTVNEQGLLTALAPGVAFISLSTGGEIVQALVSVLHHWGEYHLVWSDEFNGTALDESVWTIQQGIGNNGWGNGEKQYYTGRSENLRIENGCLVIEARKEMYDQSEYTSARIMSKGKKEFCYGKMEASISLPSGGGLWPAFWMLGNGNWPACGEIDIMEYVGNAPNRILGTLHTVKDRDGGHSSRAYTGLNNIENNFHVYGIEWTKEENKGRDVIRFYVDGEVYSEQVESVIDNNDYWPFNKPEFFIVNMAVGGSLGGRIDDNIWSEPRLMKVDWIRVYQRDELE